MKEGLVLLQAYLLGSLPWSYWIVRWTRGIDVRTVGSGNAGATNVLRTSGKTAALCALALDIAKGAVAVLVARAVDVGPAWVGLAAVAVVCGHICPLFLGLRGGKGVAAAAGALGVLSPPVFGLLLVVFVVTVALTRYVSLGSIIAALSFPPGLLLAARIGLQSREGLLELFVSSAMVAALITWRHRENIVRLRAGRENPIGRSTGGAP